MVQHWVRIADASSSKGKDRSPCGKLGHWGTGTGQCRPSKVACLFSFQIGELILFESRRGGARIPEMNERTKGLQAVKRKRHKDFLRGKRGRETRIRKKEKADGGEHHRKSKNSLPECGDLCLSLKVREGRIERE